VGLAGGVSGMDAGGGQWMRHEEAEKQWGQLARSGVLLLLPSWTYAGKRHELKQRVVLVVDLQKVTLSPFFCFRRQFFNACPFLCPQLLIIGGRLNCPGQVEAKGE
jgi:hypothetical protein